MSDSFLAGAQRRLRHLITWPEGVGEGLAQEPAGTAPLASLVRSDAQLDAEQRLTVYANAYFFRIHDVLAEDFETLFAMLGEDAFNDLATSYLAVCPSAHPSLRFVGTRLADFLEAHPAAGGLRERYPWAADLARLEAATQDVFDAADEAPATREDLAAVPPEDWDSLPLRLHPSVCLLQLAWPVHDARRAVRAGKSAPALETRPLHLGLWRREEQVVTRELDADEAHALEAVREEVEFGVLCERIAERAGEAEAAARAVAWLTGWVDAGLLLPPTH